MMRVKTENKAQAEKTNITLKLDRELLREAKVVAAKRDTSVSALVTTQLEELVRNESGYDAARKRAIARMKKGLDLGWRKPASRDELYDRKILR